MTIPLNSKTAVELVDNSKKIIPAGHWWISTDDGKRKVWLSCGRSTGVYHISVRGKYRLEVEIENAK